MRRENGVKCMRAESSGCGGILGPKQPFSLPSGRMFHAEKSSVYCSTSSSTSWRNVAGSRSGKEIIYVKNYQWVQRYELNFRGKCK